MPFTSEERETAKDSVSKAPAPQDSTENSKKVVDELDRATFETQLELIDHHVHSAAMMSIRELHQSIIENMHVVPKFSDEWFQLKEMELSIHHELRLNQVGEEERSSNKLVNKEKNAAVDEDVPAESSACPEQMPSMSDAPVPVDIAVREDDTNEELQREKAACLKPELIQEDTASPDVNIGLLSDESCNKKFARHAVETIEGDFSCPMPMPCELDDSGKVAKTQSVGFGDSSLDDESILHPPLEEADSEPELAGLYSGRSAPGGDIEHAIHEAHTTRESFDTPLIEAWAVDESSDSEKDDQSLYIAEQVVETEAWAVDESSVSDNRSVYIAEAVTAGCNTFNAKVLAVLGTIFTVALGISLYSALKKPNYIDLSTIDASTAPTPDNTAVTSSKFQEWVICSDSYQCANECCSSKYSNGTLKCTPVGGFKISEGCIGSVGTQLTDWERCANSNQCANQCCSSKWSNGTLKCTPVGGFKISEGCI
jgi:hypothetical protein